MEIFTQLDLVSADQVVAGSVMVSELKLVTP